jgi:hypothetical protein
VAPDAFFLVGTEGTPGNVDESKIAILAHPFLENHYQYRDEEAPVLKSAVDEEVVLTLPPNMKVSDLKWISVWCRKFSVDFGNLIFHSEPEVNCSDYSFNFQHKSGVISAFKIQEGNSTTDNGKLPGSCESAVTQECETKMEEECTEEIIEECETEIEEKCENVCDGDNCKEVCEEVPIQTCDNIKNLVCTPTPKEVCTNTTTSNCENGSSNETHSSPDDPYLVHSDLYGALYSAYRHASYSYLFFPYIQVYKAPNVVRAERNLTANKNYAPGYGEAFPYDEPERPLGSHINKPHLPSMLQSVSVIDGLQTQNMRFDFLSRVQGCYPMVMPLMSTLSSFFVNLAQSEHIDLQQNSSEVDRALQV